MLQGKDDKIIKGLPKVSGIAEDIFILGYDADGRDLDRTLRQVMQIWSWNNWKFNKSKYHFMWTKILFFV